MKYLNKILDFVIPIGALWVIISIFTPIMNVFNSVTGFIGGTWSWIKSWF